MGKNPEPEPRSSADAAGAAPNDRRATPSAHLFTPSMRLFERRRAAASARRRGQAA